MLNLSKIKIAGNGEVNYDLEPVDMPIENFTSGNNFRLRNGKIETFNGSKLASSVPTNFDAAKLLSVQSLAVPGTFFYLVMGLTKVEVYNGTAWYDITSTAGYGGLSAGDQFKWNNCLLGNIPIINNVQAVPEFWSPQTTGQIMQPLKYDASTTWATKGWHTKVIRSHKNFLFAIGMVEGGTTYSNSYRWSHPADNNGLPYSWDETDLSSIAGQAVILGNAGVLVDGLTLRDSFHLYSSNGITALDGPYANGYVWSAKPISMQSGVLADNCIADIGGMHIFLSDGDIILNNGADIKSVLHRLMRNRLTNAIDPTYYARSFAFANPKTKEAWICMPEVGNTYPNIAIVYNWLDGKVSIRDIAPNITDACYGPNAIAGMTWDTIPAGSWNAYEGIWDSSATSPFSMDTMAINAANSALYNLSVNDGSNLNTFIERLSVSLTEDQKSTMVVNAYPRIESSGSVMIRFGFQRKSINEPIQWSEFKTYTPSTDRKISIRGSGIFHSWRIESVGSVPFTYSGMDIEFAACGDR